MRIEFFVPGKCQPAGSKKAFVVTDKKGKVVYVNNRPIVNIVDANDEAKPWKKIVAYYAGKAYSGPLLTGPIRVTFRVLRDELKSHLNSKGERNAEGRKYPYPTSAPDVLKCSRGVEDALTGVIWKDDAQIVDERLTKEWCKRGQNGVHILIQTIDAPQPTRPLFDESEVGGTFDGFSVSSDADPGL